jgi:hypothetical protein
MSTIKFYLEKIKFKVAFWNSFYKWIGIVVLNKMFCIRFRSNLPVVSNLTAMNMWDATCMFFIYTSFLEFVVMNYLARSFFVPITHDKEPIPKIWNKYSQKRNCAGHSPNFHIHVSVSDIYIFPQSICLFCCRKSVDQSWEYVNRSQTHECGNWDWGRAIPRRGIHQ